MINTGKIYPWPVRSLTLCCAVNKSGQWELLSGKAKKECFRDPSINLHEPLQHHLSSIKAFMLFQILYLLLRITMSIEASTRYKLTLSPSSLSRYGLGRLIFKACPPGRLNQRTLHRPCMYTTINVGTKIDFESSGRPVFWRASEG